MTPPTLDLDQLDALARAVIAADDAWNNRQQVSDMHTLELLDAKLDAHAALEKACPVAVLLALLSRVRVAEQDAERYRFLRPLLWVKNERMLSGRERSCIQTAIGRSVVGDGIPTAHTPSELDHALDAAIAAAPPTGSE